MRSGYAGRGARARGLPALIGLTDPVRTPDVLDFAASLPAGSGLIYRHFGASDRFETAEALAWLAARRDLVLLVSADQELARAIGPAGLHWPEKRLAEAARWRLRHPGHLFTCSAHSPAALRRSAGAGADAALLSPVFASQSPSAGRPIGLYRAASMARDIGAAADLAVYALGGVKTSQLTCLQTHGFAGLATVSGLKSQGRSVS